MSISFLSVPIDLRTPGQYIEFDNSRALSGLLGIHQKLLLIGQRLSGGKTSAGELVRVVSVADANEKFGYGSMLARMVAAAKAANAYTEMWAVGLDDNGAGVAASGTLTFTGAATAAGTLALMVGGVRVRTAVAVGDAAAAVATAVAAAVNANTWLSVTAAAEAGVITFTARHKGEVGNSIDLRLNYYLGESTPAGLTTEIAAMSGGSGNPEVQTALDALADIQFDYLAMPYTDAANLTAMENELEGRWGPLTQIEGICFSAVKGTSAAMGTLGNTRNSQFVSILGAGKSPSGVPELAACYAAVAAFYLNIDPARPLQTLELTGMLPPRETDRLNQSERNVLLYDGISTMLVDDGGTCRIERAITTYQTNVWGVPDPSYLDVNTLATLAYIRVQVRARISGKFPRYKLADDNARVLAGQAVVRPKDIHLELVSLFRQMEDAGIVEGLEQFKADLVVERNANDKNRVDALIPPDLVGQFRVFAGQVQFRL